VGLVILPTERWDRARRLWEWADRAGFSRGWTYDHIRWSGMPDGPWTAAVPLLAAAAGVTRHIRLGTLVATPNFRHPVTLAREAIALDDICGGRLDLGVGPGSEGPDATVLGQQPWTRGERLARFAQFLEVLNPILVGAATARTSLQTPYYEAQEAPSTPGTVQQPLPLTVAAGGATGLGLAATYGRHWVTIGPTGSVVRTPETVQEAVKTQVRRLDQACVAAGRPPAGIGRILLWTPTEPVIESAEQFEEIAAPFASLGFDEFVLHHPAQTGPYGGSVSAFEEIAARHRG
jgi:alkanesulfonate monooxygenase SsuD/methylene tetrahydromethanopterin reductase-like flavin-dependent oxidoreductase (luciferase family)